MSSKQGTFFDIEPGEWGQFVVVEDEALIAEMQRRAQKRVLVGINRSYWAAAILLIKTWATYLAAEDRVEKASSRSPKRARLRAEEEEKSKSFDATLAWFNRKCECFSVEPLSRKWMKKKMSNLKDCKSYLEKAMRAEKKAKPAMSLRDMKPRKPRPPKKVYLAP